MALKKNKRKKSKSKETIVVKQEEIVSEDTAIKKSEDTIFYPAALYTIDYGLTKKKIKAQTKFIEKWEGEVVLIKMEMASGLFREFLAHDEGGFFYFKKRQFVFDVQMKYYIIERKIWAYDFHELISVPLRKKIELHDELLKLVQPIWDKEQQKPIKPSVDANELMNLIENSTIVDVEASINPLTLKRFTDSEVIKQVLQGTMLGKIFKIMFVLIIILAVFSLIQLLLSLYSSGVFTAIAGLVQSGG